VVPPVAPPPIPGPVPPPDPFPPPGPLDPINHVLSVVIASSSIPGSSVLVRSLSQKLVLTSPIITSTSSLSTLPNHASALSSAGQSISPGVSSGKPSRNVHQSSTRSPHSRSTSISHGHASHLTAPSPAPQSSPLHSIILSRNSTPHLTASHSTVPSLIPHSSARNNGVTSSSPYTLNAPHSEMFHSLTARSSAGHSTAPHARILPRNSTPHLTVSHSTAPLSSVPHSSSKHISIIRTNGNHSNNMLRSTASKSLAQSAVKSFNYPTSTRSLPCNNTSKHRQTELPAPSTD
jgi:hypothetical protein